MFFIRNSTVKFSKLKFSILNPVLPSISIKCRWIIRLHLPWYIKEKCIDFELHASNKYWVNFTFINIYLLTLCYLPLFCRSVRVRKKMCGKGQVIQIIGDVLCENVCILFIRSRNLNLLKPLLASLVNKCYVALVNWLFYFQIPHMTPYIRFCSCQLNAAALIQRYTENSSEFREIQKVAHKGKWWRQDFSGVFSI